MNVTRASKVSIGRIKEIRNASEEEIEHGHVHSAGDHQH
ncbi:MAG: FKBP-type peptidyl-prolyl cis-trans isomerase 2 [Paraglaciecola sp.]|jgi:FKBP-type peptidyl-prolyl cis-trans isomerase 2